MDVETIRELLHRRPFEPFALRMTNGDVYQVRHPENAFLAGSRLVGNYPEDNDRIAILSLHHAAAIEMLQPSR